MSIDTIMHRAARHNLEQGGVRCSLERRNGAIEAGLWVGISHGVEVVTPGETERVERRTVAEMLVAEVGELRKGDIIVTVAGSWLCAAKVNNDGYATRWIVGEYQ